MSLQKDHSSLSRKNADRKRGRGPACKRGKADQEKRRTTKGVGTEKRDPYRPAEGGTGCADEGRPFGTQGVSLETGGAEGGGWGEKSTSMEASGGGRKKITEKIKEKAAS